MNKDVYISDRERFSLLHSAKEVRWTFDH